MYVDGDMRVCGESQRAALHPPSHKKSPKGWMEKRDREGVERSAAAVSVLGGPR